MTEILKKLEFSRFNKYVSTQRQEVSVLAVNWRQQTDHICFVMLTIIH